MYVSFKKLLKEEKKCETKAKKSQKTKEQYSSNCPKYLKMPFLFFFFKLIFEHFCAIR